MLAYLGVKDPQSVQGARILFSQKLTPPLYWETFKQAATDMHAAWCSGDIKRSIEATRRLYIVTACYPKGVRRPRLLTDFIETFRMAIDAFETYDYERAIQQLEDQLGDTTDQDWRLLNKYGLQNMQSTLLIFRFMHYADISSKA